MLCSKLYALGLPSSVENATLPSRNGEISLYSLVQNARDSDSPFLPSGKSGKPYVSRHVALLMPSDQMMRLLIEFGKFVRKNDKNRNRHDMLIQFQSNSFLCCKYFALCFI